MSDCCFHCVLFGFLYELRKTVFFRFILNLSHDRVIRESGIGSVYFSLFLWQANESKDG